MNRNDLDKLIRDEIDLMLQETGDMMDDLHEEAPDLSDEEEEYVKRRVAEIMTMLRKIAKGA